MNDFLKEKELDRSGYLLLKYIVFSHFTGYTKRISAERFLIIIVKSLGRKDFVKKVASHLGIFLHYTCALPSFLGTGGSWWTYTMKDEISAAVMFLTRLIVRNSRLPSDKIEEFQEKLTSIMMENFKEHWFPDRPFKGQAYRCIRINTSEHKDSKLLTAARLCGLKYEDLNLPLELTIWVDPEEVCCRFGEFEGSYCTVASFKGDNQANYVDEIDTEDLEQKSVERTQQATFEILGGRQFTKKLPFYKHCHIKNLTSVFGVPNHSSFRTQYQALYGTSPPNQLSENSLYPSKYRRSTPSFPHANNGTYISYSNSPTNSRSDRYHWVSKSVVKA